ncbi:hypothetical protein TNCV_324201 [Trichonephila clavipes]|nr:hypothetical protein TNCV_324201 [Trichonephila clavipes]
MCDQATEAGGLVPPLQSLTKLASLRRLFLAQQPLAMELPLASPASCELRSVIRFLAAKKKSAKEIHEELCQVYGEECMSSGMVRRWVRDFKNSTTKPVQGGHRLPTKQLPKSKRQCLKIDGLQFGNCAKRFGGQQNHN